MARDKCESKGSSYPVPRPAPTEEILNDITEQLDTWVHSHINNQAAPIWLWYVVYVPYHTTIPYLLDVQYYGTMAHLKMWWYGMVPYHWYGTNFHLGSSNVCLFLLGFGTGGIWFKSL